MILAIALLWQVSAAMPLLEQGKFADARPLLERACASREANGCYLLGRTLFTLDQYEAALGVLTPLTASDESPWRVHDALGSVHEALRRPADAERHFRLAVNGNRRQSPDPAYHFGRFLVREGRAGEAVAILAQAAKAFPQYELIRFELGRAYYQTSDLTAAEAHLAAARSLPEAQRLLEKVRKQRKN